MLNGRYHVACSWLIALMLTAGVAAQEIPGPGKDITLPRVIKEVKPDHTDEAKAARIQGTVTLKVVVKDDGTVGDVQVTQSLDTQFGLDAQAVKAARQWLFKPGMKAGKPVAVQISLELTFTLK